MLLVHTDTYLRTYVHTYIRIRYLTQVTYVIMQNCQTFRRIARGIMGIFNSRLQSARRLPVDFCAADHMYVCIMYIRTSSLNDCVCSYEFIVLVISTRLPARSKV